MQNPCQKRTTDRLSIVNRLLKKKSPCTPKTFLIIGHFLTIFFCPFFLLRMRIKIKIPLIMRIIIILSLAKIVPIIVYITRDRWACKKCANNPLHNCRWSSLAITVPIILYITATGRELWAAHRTKNRASSRLFRELKTAFQLCWIRVAPIGR